MFWKCWTVAHIESVSVRNRIGSFHILLMLVCITTYPSNDEIKLTSVQNCIWRKPLMNQFPPIYFTKKFSTCYQNMHHVLESKWKYVLLQNFRVFFFLIFGSDTYMFFTYGQNVLLTNMMTAHEPMVFEIRWSLPDFTRNT